MRRVTLVAFLLVLVLAFAGCTTNPPTTNTTTTSSTPVTSTTPAATGGPVTIGTTDTITSLDPGNAYEYLSINILQMTEGTLLVNKPDSADVVPELAAAAPVVTPDGLTYTFQLKPGVKYADGTPIKASDFLWALERNSGKVGGKEGGPGFLIYDSPGVDLANSSAVDATGTLVLKLNHPGVFFNSLLVFPNFAPLPQAKYTKSAWVEPTGTTSNLPVSSGPYQVSEYRQGEFIKLTKNPNYSGPRAPKTDTITIKFFSTSSSLASALKNGEIDVAYRAFTPDEWKDLKAAGGNVKTSEAPSPSPARYLQMNTNKSPTSNKAVRQAIAYSLDRDEINSVVYSGTVSPLYGLIPSGLLGHKEAFKDKYGAKPNVAQVKALMESAGYSTSNKLKVDFWFNSDGHYGDTEDELATVIKSQLEKTGYFTVTLQSKPWAEYKVDFRASSYALFLLGWFPDYFDPDDYISPFLTAGGARTDGTFYVNEQLQSLIDQEQGEADSAKRAQTLGQIEDIAAQDAFKVPLFVGSQQAAYRSGVSGVTLSPTSVFPYYTLAK
jgi:peptide/nickel transport system substrate-binding protein